MNEATKDQYRQDVLALLRRIAARLAQLDEHPTIPPAPSITDAGQPLHQWKQAS